MADLTGDTDRRESWFRPGAAGAAVGGYGRPVARDAIGAAATTTTGRVASVDGLRGFAMFWILAGDPFAWALHDMAAGKDGPVAATVQAISDQFKHAEWEGLRFYDFLFPLFIFVVGVSIVFSLPRLVERDGPWAAHKRVITRSLLLFALGVIYYGGANNLWPDIRLLGVLQRIAFCYLFASLLFLHLDFRGLIMALVTLLVGYWALMTFVAVPEIGAGSFTKDANLARWVDAQYLPGLRVYGDWDPEGLLSTLPAIGTCLLGILAGLLLRDVRGDPLQKALLLMGVGIVLVAAGHLWALHFPIIKMIWTSSFVLVTGGYSMLLLGALYVVMDVWRHVAWATVFLWVGANAIALYMLNNLIGFHSTASKLTGGDVAAFLDQQLTKGAGSLITVTVSVLLALAIAWFLHSRRIFLRV
jgi:predicted acyltransferase